MKKKELDVISREEKSAKLSNIIVEYMMKNSMTLENLDEASVLVEEAFRKNAMLKGPTEADPKD